MYRAFCAGSIIGDGKVLTSAHCFLTNKKRQRKKIKNVRVGAGVLYTLVNETTAVDDQQWRSIKCIHTQRFFRYPAYNLAILEMTIPWIFNKYVNKIPYTRWDQDFDGVCIGTAVKPTKSWSRNKSLVAQSMRLINRRKCEKETFRNCIYYYCTRPDLKRTATSVETEGGGLICFGTGDPEEGDDGVLVGVTSLLSTKLPTLSNRIGLFHKWVADAGIKLSQNVLSLKLLIVILIIINA